MTKDEAIKLVQDALAALENISTALREDDVLGSDIELMLNTITEIHKSLAQPAQEINQPEIFCGVDYAGGVLAVSVMRRRPDDVAELLHSERIELAAPVDYIASIIACRDALDAQPVPRRWVGLTNNELQPIADEYRILFGSWVEDFARAIEAKLKEKNT